MIDNNIIIHLNKRKIAVLAAGSLIFVALSVFIFLKARTLPGVENSLIPTIISVMGVLFFGITFFYYLLKLFSNKPGLLITAEGFYDNTSAASAGFIKWTDIIGLESTFVKRKRFLLFNLKNPEEYIEKSSGIRRLLLAMNYKMYGTPVTLSANSLQCNFDRLVVIMQKELSNLLGES